MTDNSPPVSTIDTLKAVACEFREILELHLKKTPLASRHHFPVGACGDASILLGMHLKSYGFKNINYALGSDKTRSHAWLEIGDTIIDITLDQFDNNFHKVFVSKDRTYHNLFPLESRHDADIENYDSRTKSIFKETYKILMDTHKNYLETNQDTKT